jgi:hypothetical protein
MTHIGLALAVGFLSWQRAWVVAIILVLVVELWPVRKRLGLDGFLERTPLIAMGSSIAVIISIAPKALTQLALVAFYVAWRYWMEREPDRRHDLINTVVIMTAAFQAIFLASAIWHVPRLIILALVWAAIYGLSYQALRVRGEVSAQLMAAVWALVGAEAAWLFLIWQVSYILPNSYLIVPQAVVVLTAMGYCFGGILMAQRRGELSRSRLTEYLVIGAILIAIVIAGTPWRGTI